MLNKRAAKLLALVLAGSMMLSGPSASLALASSGDSKETSQTEAKEKKSESADSVKDKSSEKKKAKKQASGNSISSAKGKIAEDDDEDLPRAGVSDDSISGGSASGNVSQGDASPTLTATPSISPTATPTGRPTITPDQQADPTQNGLYGINEGATYRSGASLQFYATGAGYGPDEVQESDSVVDGATRYVPVSWNVIEKNGGVTEASGIWTKENREIIHSSMSGNTYTPGEYRFKSSFVLSSNLTASVPYTLLVNYQKEIYEGQEWKTDNTPPATKSVNFYIKNTDLITTTPTVSGQQAKKEKNGIYGIKTRYESGDTVEFYAIGAGLGPNEPQTIAPINGATRYRPYQWSVADLSRRWDKNAGVSENGIYCYKAAFEVQTSETKSYTLKVDYQKEIYNGEDWKKATGEGAAVSKKVDFYVNGGSDDPIPDQQADPTQNGLYWINEGATYRSGASLQFYATGDGYGPDTAQETDPVAGATRYVPVSWSVTATNGGATGASGTWAKRNREETRGSSSGNAYISGEYRFKGSFVLSTNLTTSVPYTLQVNYQREVYGGRKWKTDNASLATKSVNFYIRNTALTTTTPRPTSSYYNRSGVTSTAARSNISSNARNASTEDNTPIGALMLLMMAAAGSGLVIFRKKQNRS